MTMTHQKQRAVEIEVPAAVFNEKYMPYLQCRSRYLVCYGGAGSGKSYFLAQRYVLRLLNRPRCNLLVVRQVQRSNRDSTFALLRQVIQAWGVGKCFRVTESEMRIECRNGNGVRFAGLDDAEKLKSITFASGELTDIWIEEASEIQESDFNQLDIRLRGGCSDKQICLSFNPIAANHWLRKRFFDGHPRETTVVHSTYRDNRFLDAEYRKVLESYRTHDPYYYAVYCLGQWGVYGKTVFDAGAIQARLAELDGDKPWGRFSFGTEADPERCAYQIRRESIRYETADDGDICIYAPPQPGVPYVIGADTAGDGSDYFAAHVLDNRTGEQAAVLHSRFDEDVFAQQLFCLGMHYNEALIGVESNFSTYPIRELERLGYTNQVMRTRMDRFTQRATHSYGVRTTAQTRPVMLATLARVIRTDCRMLHDRATLNELLTFVRNEKGRAEAQQGAHDDLVMALAIAHTIRPQQATERPVPAARPAYTLPPELRSETAENVGNGVMTW